MKNILINQSNTAAAVLELDNFDYLLLIQLVMKGLFGDDSDLLQAVIAGDVAGWQKFVLKYANFIYRAIDKYCDDYDEKMTVFLHILEKLRENRFSRLSRFEGKAKLSTWLTIVSRRLALDFLRAKYGRDFSLKKIRVVSYDGVPSFLKYLADASTPEHEMAGAEQRQAQKKLEQALQQALQSLSAQESLAIQLVYFKGLKIKETGKLLQVRAIYKFVARALEKIRKEMESRPQFCRADVSAALGEETHE
jgi:RNA polymerase sigma factor (sigma-70 family)